MKRMAVMGSCSIPFHLRYWRELLPNWLDEVDEIVISLQQMPKKHREYVNKMLSQVKKVRVIPYPKNPWPQCMSDDIHDSKAEIVLILHDDTFILKRGVIDRFFTLAEEGKVVTPTHGIYSPADYVNRTLREMYGNYLTQFNEYSFLLYFLFMPKSIFMKTSGYLGGKGWKKGEFVDLLGRTIEENVSGDTGFQLGLDLFAHHVPFHIIPRQTTAHLQFEKDPLKAFKEISFPDGWVHFQNMANTIPQWFDGTHGINLVQNKEDAVMKVFVSIRLACMQEFLRVDEYKELEEYKRSVEKEMELIKNLFTLEQESINEYQKEIRRILCVV